MSLNDAMSDATANRISALDPGDLAAIVKCLSLGYTPATLHAGAVSVSKGAVVPLPGNLGKPRPLTINAWSFVNDAGQYLHTYGVSDSDAGALKGTLRTDPDTAIAEITAIVHKHHALKGSQRPINVTTEGMPSGKKGDSAPAPGSQGGADLVAEITRNPALYGMYPFEATDSGKPGPTRYRVPLGAGLYACFPSKRGAVNVAKICRVQGRNHPLVLGRIWFIRDGKSPLSGDDIPDKVVFDGKLKPGETPPPPPVNKAQTEV